MYGCDIAYYLDLQFILFSCGTSYWGRNFPATPTITGKYVLAVEGKFIDIDPAGNVLLLGSLNGSVNWRKWDTISGDTGLRKNTCCCIR